MPSLKVYNPYITHYSGSQMKAKKQLGQHFLIDQSVITDIMSRINAHCPSDRPLLEVGPGPGTLTYLLAEQYPQFCAIEYDKDMVAILRQKLAIEQLIQADFLQVNFSDIHKGAAFNLVGNFPYNISSQIVFKMLDYRDKIPVMVGMFQKEMAERICAQPGTKANGIITLKAQAFYTAEKLFDIPPQAFDPAPKVNSSVILMQRKPNATLPCDEKSYNKIVKMAFGQRRKKMRNTLKGLLAHKPELMDHPLLQQRPEQLGVEDFVELVGLVSA